MHRVPQDICHLAFQLKEFGESDREALESALEVIRSAIVALRSSGDADLRHLPLEEISRHLRNFSEGAISGLTTALRIQEAVQGTLMSQATRRMKRSSLDGDLDKADLTAPLSEPKGTFRTRAAGIEAVRGHIYRIDGSLLVINEIIKDKDLRAEFEETLGRLSNKLETKKNKTIKMKRAQRSK